VVARVQAQVRQQLLLMCLQQLVAGKHVLKPKQLQRLQQQLGGYLSKQQQERALAARHQAHKQQQHQQQLLSPDLSVHLVVQSRA
jgi:hypothetical protein